VFSAIIFEHLGFEPSLYITTTLKFFRMGANGLIDIATHLCLSQINT